MSNERELEAHDFLRRRKWSNAIAIYDQMLLPTANNFKAPKDRIIACLLGRCECQLELGKYENCIADALRVLKMLSEQADCAASVARVRRRLVHSLYKLKRFQEAEISTKEWFSEACKQPSFNDISKTLERYKTVIQIANGQKTNQRISLQRLDDEMATLDTKLEHWATNNLPLDKFSKLLTNKGMKSAGASAAAAAAASASSTSSSSSSSSSVTIPTTVMKRDSLGSSSSASTGSASTTSNSNSSNNNSNNSNGPDPKQSHQLARQLQQQQKAIEQITAKLNLNETSGNSDGSVTCSYCAISCADKNELRQHCQTESHQNVIMSDEGRDWKWRPPPRGFTADSYSLCESYSESQSCHYGNQCVEAHGAEELKEWKERFEYRRRRLQRACEKELYGKSYTEELLEKWVQATSPDKVMREKIDTVEETCSNELVTTISSKVSKREWLFVLKTQRPIRAVALLQDSHRHYFSIKSIAPGDSKTASSSAAAAAAATIAAANSKKSTSSSAAKQSGSEVEPKCDQEWVAANFDRTFKPAEDSPVLEHRVKIAFSTDIYGTFRQSVCFDFGCDPVLVRHICVDVVPVGEAEKIQEIKKDIISSSSTRWDETNSMLIKFETTIGSHLKTEAYLNDLKREKDLLERYPCPRAATFTLTQSTILDRRLTKNNYRSRIHELLYVEEIARYEQIARYNLATKLRIASNYMLTPSGMATSTAKYSHSGELFALMSLGKDVSEDTSAGRLILSNCLSVYLSSGLQPGETEKGKQREVYEAMIEDKGKNMIYLKLAAKCVQGLNLKADTDFQADIQFQLNRLSYCEWHNAVDQIADFRIIFPDTYIEPNIPWTPKKQWSDACDPKLNTKQKEAINAITTPVNCQLPPILLIGPFGTGKTYTLAQAIKQLLTQPDAKILICTHSNSAADLYIKEYLHPWVEKGMKEATPLRVYYHKRWVATVNSVVQKYCIIDGNGNFRRPSVDDILKHRIVVVTLNISMELATLGLPKGYFTHIFLDEAAQAMECEAIMPLALANENTRIVLAGDHMQMSPELFSNFAKERKLHISLLERLYDHYPSNYPCKILLCENYRAHEAIIKFTSELFYEQKLIASGKQPRHEKFYPLTFFTTRGEDVQDKNSTAFYNNSEVYEVVERVCELKKKWPSSWGKISDQSIGIMTPYADQVFRIRSELRKRRMGGISVERVLNVQGKQFRAIFLSTVRTRRTCTPNNSAAGNSEDDSDYGFLSNSKLLNTAITRAQSLVAVVGDPVALCSIGRCRKVWERFIEICHQNKSLFGMTWSYLRSQLDGVELKRSYVLNPLAPEFIPRALQPESYLRQQSIAAVAAVAANQQVMQSTTSQSMNQMPQNYPTHPYGMMNQNAVGQQMLQKSVQPPAPHTSPMQMRPIGHPPQPYNMPGPQPPPPPSQATTTQQQYPPYSMWPQQQQAQPQTSQQFRPGYPPQSNMPPQQHTNAGVGLWGPPPQNNPWGVVPKPGSINPNVNPNIRPPVQPPIQTQPLNMTMNNLNMRPPAAALQALQQPPPPPPIQTMRNPQDLTHLNKFAYPNATNFNNQNTILLNQPNMRNQLHNGPPSPADITRTALAGSIQHLSNANNFSAHPYLTNQPNIYAKEKEIQFLNNVHNIPVNMNSGGPLQAPPNTQPFPDFSVLLPPNMNFYDMALEPKEFQYKWYLHLLEHQGQEAANKFTDILRQVMAAATSMTTKGLLTHPQQPQMQQQSMPPQMQANAGSLRNANLQQISQLGSLANSALSSLNNSTLATGGGMENNNINFNQQIDLVFNSLMNGNEMSQPILRDLLGMVSSTTNNASGGTVGGLLGKETTLQHPQPQHSSQLQQQQQQQQQQQHSQLMNSNPLMASGSSIGSGSDLTISSRVESVPLYRRQVMGNGSSGFGSTPSSHPASIGSPDLINDTLNNPGFIESLFSSNDINAYTSVNAIQKLFNSYDLKSNECADILLNSRNSSQLQAAYGQQHPIQSQHQQSHGNSNPNNNHSSHVTYAAVLSQGPGLSGSGNSGQQQQQQQQQPQQQQQTLGSHMHLNSVIGPVASHANPLHAAAAAAAANQSQHSDTRDPFAAIRELGQRSNGFYNYFQ